MRASRLRREALKADRGRGAAVAFFPVGPAAALLVVGIMLCPVLRHACADPRTNLQVVLWQTEVPSQKESVKELVRAFQEAHPDVLVCLEWRDAAEAEQSVRDWFGSYGGTAPDVTVIADLWLQEHHRRLLLPGRRLQRALGERLVPSVLLRGAVGGVLCGVPWTVVTEALYYRSDLLAEVRPPGRPPTSFAELVECAAALADPPNRYGFGLPGAGGGAEELLYALALAAGGEIGGEDGEISPAAEPFERALTVLADMQTRGALQPEVLTWTEAELAELLVQGRLAMMVGRPWLGVMLDEAEQQIAYKTARLPRERGGTGRVAVDWLVAFGNTDRREQALKFLEFAAQEFWQRELAEMGGVPATRALTSGLRKTPRWAAHIQGLERAGGLPPDQWGRLKAQLGNALSYALSGRCGVKEALEQAAQLTHP